MIRKIQIALAITLLTALLSNIIRFTVVDVYYLVNKAEIIELFCINKDKPELKCDGKCHLKSVIEDISTDTQDQSIPEGLKELSLSLFIVLEKAPPSNSIESYSPHRLFNFCETENQDFLSSIFHPPIS